MLIETMKAKEAFEAIESLQKSTGWALITEFLDRDVTEAVYEFGENPNMEERELHFRRGTIHATKNFRDLPKKLEMYFENQLRLEH